MRLRFTKMQGAGNDFVVLDGISQRVDLSSGQLRALADRRFGVGADQILVVEAAQASGVDFRYRIFNADGNEVEQCGNGARCFAKFVHDQGLTQKRAIVVETLGGLIVPRLEPDGQVSVDMGAPVFDTDAVPFDASGLVPVIEGRDALWPLTINDHEVLLSVLSIGNPHAVQRVASLDTAAVQEDGPLIERHRRFAQGVNAGYMEVIDAHRIVLRVWERGAGETLACGTGACAAVVAGIRRGWLSSPVAVKTRGGTLAVAWEDSATETPQSVWLSGPAATVYEGEIDIDQLAAGP
jgi:diaminopimelate epimerase